MDPLPSKDTVDEELALLLFPEPLALPKKKELGKCSTALCRLLKFLFVALPREFVDPWTLGSGAVKELCEPEATAVLLVLALDVPEECARA